MNLSEALHLVRHHPPKDEDVIRRIEDVRNAAEQFVKAVWGATPVCAEQTLAFRAIHKATQDAIAAIVFHQSERGPRVVKKGE